MMLNMNAEELADKYYSKYIQPANIPDDIKEKLKFAKNGTAKMSKSLLKFILVQMGDTLVKTYENGQKGIKRAEELKKKNMEV